MAFCRRYGRRHPLIRLAVVCALDLVVGAAGACNNLIDGGGWLLYMYNGADGQHKNLRYGEHSSGYGSVASMPTSGGHKMAEDVFDAHNFTEVLALGSDGAGVKISKTDGSAIRASEAFAVETTPNIVLTRLDTGASTTWSKPYVGSEYYGRNHGPFYHDTFGNRYAWMWTDDAGSGDLTKGTVLGEGGATLTYAWAWYGRCHDCCPPTHSVGAAGVCDNLIHGGGWLLYMYNGADGQHKNLRYGEHSPGYGSVASMPTSGGHKMAEDVFDAHSFTEVLALGSDGAGVKISKTDGSAIRASEAFAVETTPNIVLTRLDTGASTTWSKPYVGSEYYGRNHGPFYHDTFGKTYAWMWTDDQGSSDLTKGSVLGKGEPILSYAWAWYGRCHDCCSPTNTTATTSTSVSTTDTTAENITASSTTTVSLPSTLCEEIWMVCPVPSQFAGHLYQVLGSEDSPLCQSGGSSVAPVFNITIGNCNSSYSVDAVRDLAVRIVTLVPKRGTLQVRGSAVPALLCICEFAASGAVVGTFQTLPDEGSTVRVAGNGSFTPVLQFFLDDSFKKPLAPTDDVPANTTRFYFEVASLTHDDTIVVSTIIFSPTANESDPDAVTVLQSFCLTPQGGELQLEWHSTESNRTRRFSLVAFRFASYHQAYVRALVERCNPGESCGGCPEAGGRPSRRLEARIPVTVSQFFPAPYDAMILPAYVATDQLASLWESVKHVDGVLTCDLSVYGVILSARSGNVATVFEGAISRSLGSALGAGTSLAVHVQQVSGLQATPREIHSGHRLRARMWDVIVVAFSLPGLSAQDKGSVAVSMATLSLGGARETEFVEVLSSELATEGMERVTAVFGELQANTPVSKSTLLPPGRQAAEVGGGSTGMVVAAIAGIVGILLLQGTALLLYRCRRGSSYKVML